MENIQACNARFNADNAGSNWTMPLPPYYNNAGIWVDPCLNFQSENLLDVEIERLSNTGKSSICFMIAQHRYQDIRNNYTNKGFYVRMPQADIEQQLGLIISNQDPNAVIYTPVGKVLIQISW